MSFLRTKLLDEAFYFPDNLSGLCKLDHEDDFARPVSSLSEDRNRGMCKECILRANQHLTQTLQKPGHLNLYRLLRLFLLWEIFFSYLQRRAVYMSADVCHLLLLMDNPNFQMALHFYLPCLY